jgi:subtilisin-like proprotein convertase family protein
MNSLKKLLPAVLCSVMCVACGDKATEKNTNTNNNGKEDNIGEMCPERVGINGAQADKRRCYDQDSGRFVPTDCCRDLCSGAGWREQQNGTFCVWVGEPGVPTAQRGQFAPNMCCHLNEGIEAECHPPVHARIRDCAQELMWEWEYDHEALPVTSWEAMQLCATEGDLFGPIHDELCAPEPAFPFCGLSTEAFSEKVMVPCMEELRSEYDCAFGLSYYDAFSPSGRITVAAERTLTLADADSLTNVAREQVLEAVRQSAWFEVTSLEEAFDHVDFGEIYYKAFWEGSTARAFEVYEYGAGDNSFGAFFEYGVPTLAVSIQDGDLYDAEEEIGCGIPLGERWNRCDSDAGCAAGLICEGIIDHPLHGLLGRCVDPDLGLGSSVYECTEEQSCELDKGLICSGMARYGSGFCRPAWMARTFKGAERVDIPDGDPQGVQTSVWAYGLATVDEEVNIDMSVSHDDFTQLRITMTNPYGLEGDVITVFDGSKPWHMEEIDADSGWARIKKTLYFSGDEEVNGPWTLYLVDNTPGVQGRLYSWELYISSRYD